jgi:hypothetical protein
MATFDLQYTQSTVTLYGLETKLTRSTTFGADYKHQIVLSINHAVSELNMLPTDTTSPLHFLKE